MCLPSSSACKPAHALSTWTNDLKHSNPTNFCNWQTHQKPVQNAPLSSLPIGSPSIQYPTLWLLISVSSAYHLCRTYLSFAIRCIRHRSTCRKLVGENLNHDFAQGDLSGHSSCKLNLWHYEILALIMSCNSETWKARCVLTQGWTSNRRCWAQEARSLFWHHLSGPVVTCN
jgi:hypothetical protein